MKFNCHVEFDVKKNKNNKKLVGSYLRCAYNHVLLEKTSRLYQIRCLTRRKLRIYLEHALFHRLSHSWQAVIGFDQIFGFVSKRSGSLRWSGVSRIHFKQKKSDGLNWSQIGLISKSDLNVNEAYSGVQLEKENMKNPSVPRPSLRWLRDQERLERYYTVGHHVEAYTWGETEIFEKLKHLKKMKLGGDKYSYGDKQDILKAFWRQRSGF